jgi:hypothetical protein
MTWRNYSFLFLISLFFLLPVAYFQNAPGYMDADYYFAGGLRFAGGYGFSEMILWNYLDDPVGLPHPSHAYWLPLASLISATGMVVTGEHTFAAAKIGFILIAGMIPPITAALSYSLTRRKDFTLLSGLLAVIPGFYLSYLATTDTFGIYILLGGIWLLVAGKRIGNTDHQNVWLYRVIQPLLLGLISGFMHLARADGLIWFILGFYVCIWPAKENNSLSWSIKTIILRLVMLIISYLIVMGPWMLRSLNSFNTLLSPGGFHIFWITEYDEIYTYPASILTPARWWAIGFVNILQSRIHAFSQNIQTTLAVQGQIFLVPLIIMGLWRLRIDYRVRLGISAWAAILLSMTLIFPEVGWRGGFFHSGASVQTLFWAVVPVGLDIFIKWGVRVRRWHPTQSRTFFSIGLIGLALMLTIIVVQSRVIGSNIYDPIWGKSDMVYRRLETALLGNGAELGEVVLVNNAPGYYIATGRPAISIPNGDESTMLEVAKRYAGRFLLLEYNHPQGLSEIYDHPGDRPGLKYLSTIDGTHIFKIMH